MGTATSSGNDRTHSDAIVVACLGDSITRGVGSFDWIAELAARSHNARFVFHNLGVDGDLAYSALQRVHAVVRVDPDVVLVEVGANDVMTSVIEKMRRVIGKQKRLPQDPSPQWFEENLNAIVTELRRETSARVVLVSPPQMGEDPASTEPLQSELNARFEQCANTVKRIAHAHGADYVPFFEAMREQLIAEPGRSSTGFSFGGYYRDLSRQYLLHRELDDIGLRNGWRFHTEGIHLNTRGGMILAGLVQDVLDRVARPDDVRGLVTPPVPGSLECRGMQPAEADAVLALVSRSFDRFVRPDFSEEGVAEFESSSRRFILERPPGHALSVALLEGELVGMLDIRDCSHVAHFFVDPAYHGRGIGRRLFEWGVDRCRSEQPGIDAITVNSSPWAVPVYESLGFVATGPLAEQCGIRYVPMVRALAAAD